MYSAKVGNATLELVEADITQISVDAIVNAANSGLVGGGGVDGAIHRAGGPEVMRELSQIRVRIGSCPAGSAVATGAGRLPAQFIFHAVGPVFRGGESGEPAKLAGCYRTCLDMAAERNLASISFPSISTGAYGYPVAEAAEIAVNTVCDWLASHQGPVQLVKLVQFDDADHRIYLHAARLRLNSAADTARM